MLLINRLIRWCCGPCAARRWSPAAGGSQGSPSRGLLSARSSHPVHCLQAARKRAALPYRPFYYKVPALKPLTETSESVSANKTFLSNVYYRCFVLIECWTLWIMRRISHALMCFQNIWLHLNWIKNYYLCSQKWDSVCSLCSFILMKFILYLQKDTGKSIIAFLNTGYIVEMSHLRQNFSNWQGFYLEIQSLKRIE